MKKIIALLLFLFSALIYAENITIVLPAVPSAVEKTAASELELHLKKVADIKIASENDNVSGKIIYIGNTKVAPKDKFGAEEWKIQAIDNQKIIINGGKRGVIYGAFELLERLAGVMFLDEYSTFGPTQVPQWEANLKLQGKPTFAYRSTYSYFSGKQSRYIWNIRQRQNFFLNEKISDSMKAYGFSPVFGRPRANHVFYDYTKNWKNVPEEYFSFNPRTKKRERAVNSSGPGQVCFSHPEVRKLFIAQLKEYIKQDIAEYGELPRYYALSANDNWYPCACKMCLDNVKKMGNYTALSLDFTNAIADAIAKEYPDIRIKFSVYLFTQNLPPKGTRIAKNIIPGLAQMGPEWSNTGTRVIRDTLRSINHPLNDAARKEILNWNKFGILSSWDYFITYRDTAFLTENSEIIAENYKFYKDKFESVFAEVEEPLSVSFHPLRMYIGQRFMYNADLNAQQEIKRFMSAYYGDAADEMEAIRQLIKTENNSITGYMTAPLISRKNLNSEYFAKAEKLFNSALAKVNGNSDITRRILRERIQFDRVRMMLGIGSKEIADRALNDFQNIAPFYFVKHKSAEAVAKFKKEISGVLISTAPIAELEGREVIGHFRGNAFPKQYRATPVVDPDSEMGTAISIKGNDPIKKGVTFGFSDRTTKKSKSITIPYKSFRFDGKYHWYLLGDVTLSSDCFAYIHHSWEIQRELKDLFGAAPDNKVELAFKIKAVLDEKNPEIIKMLYVDGVAALKPLPPGSPKPITYYNSTPLADFPDREIIGRYSGDDMQAKYKTKKVKDNDAIEKSAIVKEVNDPINRGIRIGYFNINTKKSTLRTLTPKMLILDGKYHWYSLGPVKISDNGYAHVHVSTEFQKRLDLFAPAGTAEVAFRIKAETDADKKIIKKIYLDSIAVIKSGYTPSAEFPDKKILARVSGNELFPQYRTKKISDNDAFNKSALMLEVNDPVARGIRIGYFDINSKKATNLTIPPKKLILDGKYHRYSLGKVKISQNGYAHAHVSSEIQRRLDDFAELTEDGTVELIFRIKAETDTDKKVIKKIYLDAIEMLKP